MYQENIAIHRLRDKLLNNSPHLEMLRSVIVKHQEIKSIKLKLVKTSSSYVCMIFKYNS